MDRRTAIETRIAEILTPAVNANAPYAKVMIGMIADLVVIEAQRMALPEEVKAKLVGLQAGSDDLPPLRPVPDATQDEGHRP